MRKHGYDTHLFFLGTNDVEINKKRVQQRVHEGGHDIAVPIIEHRYSMGLSYLKSQLIHFNEVRLIDVSSDKPQEMATLKLGKILFKHKQLETWAENSLFIAERLQNRQAREGKEIKSGRRKGLG